MPKQLGPGRSCTNDSSLVPSPSPLPVFDCFRYANIEGEGLGDFVLCSDGRGRRNLSQRVWCPTVIICIDQSQLYRTTSCIESGDAAL